MKNKKFRFQSLIDNNWFVLLISFVTALSIWILVTIYASSEITRVIPNVKVTVDTAVPSQFGLEVFGDNEFFVDVTVKGKKYLVSAASLSADDISVVANTSNVDSAGVRTLQLKAESVSDSKDYEVISVSQKSIDVYFDTPKTVEMVIEPKIKAKGFPIVKEGFTTGEIKLSDTSVTVSGPSAEVNNIKKIVASVTLSDSLSSNKTANAKIVPLDKKGKNSFKFITLSLDKVDLAIPVLQMKTLPCAVTFKNAPDSLVLNPLKYSINPAEETFDISVDDYEKTKDYSVGVIDFKLLSPSNHVFEFNAGDTAVSKNVKTEEFVADVDMSGYEQDYYTVSPEVVKIINSGKKSYKVYSINKSVIVVGKQKDLDIITENDISVTADLSDVEIMAGQSISVPVQVTLKSSSCWVYGTYYAEVALLNS